MGQSNGPLQSGGRVVWNTVLTRPPQQSVTFQAPAVSTLTTQLFVQRYLTPLKVVSLSAFASPVASARPAASTTLPRERLSILRLRCGRPIGRGTRYSVLQQRRYVRGLLVLTRNLSMPYASTPSVSFFLTLRISREEARGFGTESAGSDPTRALARRCPTWWSGITRDAATAAASSTPAAPAAARA